MPVRVKIELKAGWRKQSNARDVTHSTPFGNPFVILSATWRVIWIHKGAGAGREPPADFEPTWCESEHQARELAVRLFREWLTAPAQADLLEAFRHELRGFNLACWCPLDLPCHADVLLDLVNRS
jgi:hypothetical protein